MGVFQFGYSLIYYIPLQWRKNRYFLFTPLAAKADFTELMVF